MQFPPGSTAGQLALCPGKISAIIGKLCLYSAGVKLQSHIRVKLTLVVVEGMTPTATDSTFCSADLSL